MYLLDVDKGTKKGFLCKWYIIISQNRIQKSPDVIELDAWLTNTFSAEKAFRVRGNTRMYVRILVRLLIDFAFCPYPPNFEFNYVECLLAISTFFKNPKLFPTMMVVKRANLRRIRRMKNEDLIKNRSHISLKKVEKRLKRLSELWP